MANEFYVVSCSDPDYNFDPETVGVFSTLEKANEFINQFPDMGCFEPEEVLVDALCYYTERRKSGLRPYFVSVDINGWVENVYELKKPTIGRTQRVGDLLYSYCWADTADEAIKITNNRRFEMIMENSWRQKIED